MNKELKHLTKEEYKLYKEYIRSGALHEVDGKFYMASRNDPYGEEAMDIYDLIRYLAANMARRETLELFTEEQRAEAKARYRAAKWGK